MGVLSLTRLIQEDANSYRISRLHNINVIVNGIEYLHILLDKNKCVGAFGHDFLQVKSTIIEGVNLFLKCKIKPIFVFSGIPPRNGKDFQWKASKNLKKRHHFDEQSIAVSADNYAYNDQFMIYSKSIVCSVLSSMQLPFVVCSYSAVPVSAALSIMLGCPVISSNSELFLFSKPQSIPEYLSSTVLNNFQFAPLSGLDLTATEDADVTTNNESNFFLNAYMFDPECAPIRIVPELSRPLIALLMDSFIVYTLPDDIKINDSASTDYKGPMLAKLNGIIQWLSKANPVDVMKSILECIHEPVYACSVAGTVVDFLAKFVPDFSEACKILSFMNFPADFPTPASEKLSSSANLESPTPVEFFLTVVKLLNGENTKYKRIDFMDQWSNAVKNLYRSGKLHSNLPTGLYTQDGSVFDSPTIFLYKYSSVCDKSRVLRFLQYCILVGIEQSNGLSSKLIGLRPHVKEICYEGSFEYKSYFVHVTPLIKKDTIDAGAFIDTFFNYHRSDTIPEWCDALVLSCLIWHSQKLTESSHANCTVSQCPVILSFLVSAIVNYYNTENEMSTIHEHYTQLSKFALEEIKKNTPETSCESEKVFIHSTLGLLAVYSELISLNYLLTALDDKDPATDIYAYKYSKFLDTETVLPSLKLVIHISRHIEFSDVSTRSNLASRFWLPKLFVRSASPKVVSNLREAATLMTNVIEFISCTTIKWTPPVCDIADPPLCYIPKEKRQAKNTYHLKPQPSFPKAGPRCSTDSNQYRPTLTPRPNMLGDTSFSNQPQFPVPQLYNLPSSNQYNKTARQSYGNPPPQVPFPRRVGTTDKLNFESQNERPKQQFIEEPPLAPPANYFMKSRPRGGNKGAGGYAARLAQRINQSSTSQ